MVYLVVLFAVFGGVVGGQLSGRDGSTSVVCDPVCVAEMPEAHEQLLKIEHFDEIGRVMDVEI